MKEEVLKDKVKKLKELGINNSYFVKKIGLSKSTISLWLKNERVLRDYKLFKLQKAIEELKEVIKSI